MDSAESAPRVQINSSSLGMLNLRVVFKNRTLNFTINHVFMYLPETHRYQQYKLSGPSFRCPGPAEPFSLVYFDGKGMPIKPENTFMLQSNYLFALPKAASSFIVLLRSPCYLPVCSKGGAWLW